MYIANWLIIYYWQNEYENEYCIHENIDSRQFAVQQSTDFEG